MFNVNRWINAWRAFDNILKFKKTSNTGDDKTKYTKYLVKKYLKWLKELDINPLLIPKNFKVDLGPEKKIENPLADVFLFSWSFVNNLS